MVNIQDAGVFACQLLNRDLWSVPYVKEVVKENFVFLQVSIVYFVFVCQESLVYRCSRLLTTATTQFYSDSTEGKKYATYYPLKGFPHIAIIDPRTGNQEANNRGS
jgi:thioredoxin-related protein